MAVVKAEALNVKDDAVIGCLNQCSELLPGNVGHVERRLGPCREDVMALKGEGVKGSSLKGLAAWDLKKPQI